MLRYSNVAKFAALLLAAGVSACGGSSASSNPMIGKWHLSKEVINPSLPDLHCQPTDMVFTATTQTVVNQGVSATTPATYNVSPQLVYVMGTRGIVGAVPYKIVDANDIENDDVLACTYHRLG